MHVKPFLIIPWSLHWQSKVYQLNHSEQLHNFSDKLYFPRTYASHRSDSFCRIHV